MKIIIFAVLSILAFNCQAQLVTDSTKKQQLSQDTTFYPQEQLEIPAAYPFGPRGWKNYLEKNIKSRYVSDNPDNKIKVNVQFTVDMQGHVGIVEAIDGPTGGGYQQEAVRVVKKSGFWLPAVRNGHKVNSYRKLAIEF